MSALVLFSGGLDSTTLLCDMLRGADEVIALVVGYPSKHNATERYHAQMIINHLRERGMNVGKRVIEIDENTFLGSKSTLIKSGSEIPDETYRPAGNPSSTYVPFRNGVMIANAVAVAMSMGIARVVYAAHKSDWGTGAYPDCTPEFVSFMSSAVRTGTNEAVIFSAPYIDRTKAWIVSHGTAIGAPLEMTWSCYRSGDVHCGTCPTCRERKDAFVMAGIADPTTYAVGGDRNENNR